MRVQRYTDKSIYVQHFYIKNNTEHKKRKYIIKKFVNLENLIYNYLTICKRVVYEFCF